MDGHEGSGDGRSRVGDRKVQQDVSLRRRAACEIAKGARHCIEHRTESECAEHGNVESQLRVA